MTIQAAADYLSLSRETLYKYVNQGVLPAVRIGRHWRFDQRTLMTWMAEQSRRVPCVAADEGRPMLTESSPAGSGHAMNVLVVDDDSSIRRLLGVWIQAEGHRVDQAESGAQAIRQLTARRYDLMFLDLLMPGMTGGQVLGRMQNGDRLPPVVLMTGTAESPLLDQALQCDLAYVLSKPFTRDHVRKLLHAVRATRTATSVVTRNATPEPMANKDGSRPRPIQVALVGRVEPEMG